MKYIPMRYYSDGNYGEQFQFKFIAKKKKKVYWTTVVLKGTNGKIKTLFVYSGIVCYFFLLF